MSTPGETKLNITNEKRNKALHITYCTGLLLLAYQ